ncbi:MAG: DMT family transporter, partial [Pseudobdellovibrionaceae bacterium]
MNLFLYFLALICLSQSPTLIRWAHAPAEIIGFWRLLVSALLFAPWVQWRQLNGKKLMLCLGSGVFFFLHLWTFSLAAQNTAIANAMIIYSVNPLFTALGAYLFFKEKFTPRLGLAYIFAFLGIYYLVSHSLEFSPTSVRGDIYALISAPLFACFILLGQKMRKQLGVVTFSFVTYASTSVLFGCVALFHQISLTNYPQQTWIAIAGTIVLPTLLGHSLITYLLA